MIICWVRNTIPVVHTPTLGALNRIVFASRNRWTKSSVIQNRRVWSYLVVRNSIVFWFLWKLLIIIIIIYNMYLALYLWNNSKRCHIIVLNSKLNYLKDKYSTDNIIFPLDPCSFFITCTQLPVQLHNYQYRENISSRFSRSSEAFASRRNFSSVLHP